MNRNEDEEMQETVYTASWRKDERRRLWSRIIRWGLAIPMLALSLPFLGPIGPFFVVLGSILIAPDIAGYCSRAFIDLVQHQHQGKITPMYGIPESLVARGQYAEAEQEYEKIIEEYPDEVKPHIDLINIAVARLNNPELAEQLYQRALTLLHEPSAREIITSMYESMKTRLKSESAINTVTIPLEHLTKIKDQLARDRPKWRQ